MTDEPEIPAETPAITTAAKKSRGRPPSPKPETPQQRIDRLQAELQQAHQAKKIAEQQRDAIVGAVVTRHALANHQFRRQLTTILRAEVKSKTDLATLAELLT